ncbi:MAG: GGDEF domain-containing protein [Kineosporiaceae bacterium]
MTDGSARVARERAECTRAIAADRAVRAAAAAALCWVVLYAVALAATASSATASRFVQVVVCVAPFAVLACTNVVTYRRSRGRKRRMWRVFAGSASATLAGMLAWVVGTYVPSMPAAIGVANLLLVLALVVLVPGYLLGFGGTSLIRHSRNLVDAALLAITLGALGWYLLVTPRLTRHPDVNGWVDIGFVLLDVAVMVTLFSGGLAGHRTVPVSVLVWMSGMIVGCFTDAVTSYLSLGGSVGDGGWANVGWQTQGVLLVLGSLIAARHDEPDAQPQLMDRDISVPLLLLSAAGVVVVLIRELGDRRVGVLVVVMVMIVGPMLRQLLIIRDRTRLSEALTAALAEQERLATTDGLTGLCNRRRFNELVRAEGERSAGSGTPMAVIILDLDHFKRINDTRGHLVGDAVLVEVSARLRRHADADVVVARFGGEEFAVLVPGGDASTARALAERLRAAVASAPVAVGEGEAVAVTASFGVASSRIAAERVDADLDRLVRAADHALYLAKERGRDRTVVARDDGAARLPSPAGVPAPRRGTGRGEPASSPPGASVARQAVSARAGRPGRPTRADRREP